MDNQRESDIYNQMADYYDKYRPGYPNEIVSAIIQKAKLGSGSRLLEIGAGSGKATEQFANRGFTILCLEPGKDLARAGNARFEDDNIRFVASSFEDFCVKHDYYDRTKAIASGIIKSGLFSEPEVSRSYWDKTYSVDEYYNYMLTSHVFYQKTNEEKQACYAELSQLASNYDGVIKRQYVCELYLAQKV